MCGYRFKEKQKKTKNKNAEKSERVWVSESDTCY